MKYLIIIINNSIINIFYKGFYLKEQRENRVSLSANSLPKCIENQGLGQYNFGTTNYFKDLHWGGSDQITCAFICCLSRCPIAGSWN